MVEVVVELLLFCLTYNNFLQPKFPMKQANFHTIL